MGLRKGKQVFFRAGAGVDSPNQYRWQPTMSGDKVKFKKKVRKQPNCTATPGSQGEDNDTGYCYKLNIINGVEHHIAYVECDYVE